MDERSEEADETSEEVDENDDACTQIQFMMTETKNMKCFDITECFVN